MFKNASHGPSFKVIVFCYKPSGSILNFFELILKAYTRGIPNRITMFQDWAHQSFICCLFYLLWTSVKISSQEAKSPISLRTNIAVMCILSQIICESDPMILHAFDIFEDRSLQSIWSMDLLDPFPCYLHHIAFDRLKSHTPFPCPTSQLIYIFPKCQCVLYILNFSVANTVIHKESYFRINICWDVIYEQRKQQGTRQNRGPIRFCSVYNSSLLSVAQKRVSSHLLWNSIGILLLQEFQFSSRTKTITSKYFLLAIWRTPWI